MTEWHWNYAVTRHGFVEVRESVPAYHWRCYECGFVGLNHTSERGAVNEACRHFEKEHPELGTPWGKPAEQVAS